MEPRDKQEMIEHLLNANAITTDEALWLAEMPEELVHMAYQFYRIIVEGVILNAFLDEVTIEVPFPDAPPQA